MAELRYVTTEKVMLYYEAYRLTTGLSDVTISIVKDDGTKLVDGEAMSELNSTNAPGVYYYTLKFTSGQEGNYLIYCDSASKQRTQIYSVVIMGRSSRYTQVMGVHGGMSRTIMKGVWTKEEKEKIIDKINQVDELPKALDVLRGMQEILSSLVGKIEESNIKPLQRELQELKESVDDPQNLKIELSVINDRVANLTNGIVDVKSKLGSLNQIIEENTKLVIQNASSESLEGLQ